MSRGWVGGVEGFSYTAFIVAAAELLEAGLYVEGLILLVAGFAIAWWHHRKGA